MIAMKITPAAFCLNACSVHYCLCRSPKEGKKGLYVAEKVVQFPLTSVGKRSEMKVKICNGSADTQYLVSFIVMEVSIIIDYYGYFNNNSPAIYVLSLYSQAKVLH